MRGVFFMAALGGAAGRSTQETDQIEQKKSALIGSQYLRRAVDDGGNQADIAQLLRCHEGRVPATGRVMLWLTVT